METPMTTLTNPGTNPDALQPLWHLPPFGAEGGYATEGDVLANTTADGQHPQRRYQGMRTIPGLDTGYLLQDAYFQRSFGVGVRRRGQACITQIKPAGSYVAPVIPK
jgi:hypothetical protein